MVIRLFFSGVYYEHAHVSFFPSFAVSCSEAEKSTDSANTVQSPEDAESDGYTKDEDMMMVMKTSISMPERSTTV